MSTPYSLAVSDAGPSARWLESVVFICVSVSNDWKIEFSKTDPGNLVGWWRVPQ